MQRSLINSDSKGKQSIRKIIDNVIIINVSKVKGALQYRLQQHYFAEIELFPRKGRLFSGWEVLPLIL